MPYGKVKVDQVQSSTQTINVDDLLTAASLSSSTSSTSTTTGANSAAVKSAYDLANAALPKAGGTLTGDLTLNANSDLRFADADSSNWVAFQAPTTVTSNVTWTLPGLDGSNGQYLTTGGNGVLSWTAGLNLDTAQTWTKAQRGTIVALTSAATVTADFATANNFSLTLAHSLTIANPSNQTAGQSGAIVITQGSGTAYTVSYGSNWKFSGGTPTMSTGLSSVSVLVYYVESASRITAQLLTNVT